MASDFTAPEAEEPSCTIIRTLQPNVLWPARLEMMKSIDFCFSQGTNTLSCGLKESEFSYNQIYFFFLNRITDCFRVFLVSSMAPSKLCKVGCLVIQHLALWGGSHLLLRPLKNWLFFFWQKCHMQTRKRCHMGQHFMQPTWSVFGH